jgi:heme o synthase
MILSQQEGERRKGIIVQNSSSLISDLRLLFKGLVLVSNVLPVFTGLWLAMYFTDVSFASHWDVALLTLVGSIMVMGGALVLNNWYDVDIDSIMERTKKRPTVTGTIPLKVVLFLGISLSVAGFILLFFTTVSAVVYAFIGWFTYVVLYTMWSKRRYAFNTIIGSISGAVTPLIGWFAIDTHFHTVPFILFLILFVWQMPHTFAIAIKKYDEYKAAGVAMLPVVRGIHNTKVQMLFYIACLVPLPFFVQTLGITFVTIVTLLNVIWCLVSVWGFFVKDTLKWANVNFIYSVNYITLVFFFMIVVTIF